MASLSIEIADAVANTLNTAPEATFSQRFQAIMRLLPQFELEKLTGLEVSVVPKAIEMTAASRTLSQVDVSVDIGVMKKLGRKTDAEAEPLMELVQEIIDYMHNRQLTGISNHAWIRAANEPIYAPDYLEQNLFVSVITLTYRVLR